MSSSPPGPIASSSSNRVHVHHAARRTQRFVCACLRAAPSITSSGRCSWWRGRKHHVSQPKAGSPPCPPMWRVPAGARWASDRRGHCHTRFIHATPRPAEEGTICSGTWPRLQHACHTCSAAQVRLTYQSLISVYLPMSEHKSECLLIISECA